MRYRRPLTALTWVISLALLGCVGQGPEDEGPARPAIPSPYVYAGETLAQPTDVGPNVRNAALESALRTALLADPKPLLAFYQELMALADKGGDEACPEMESVGSKQRTVRWSGDCKAQSGASFKGRAELKTFDAYVEAEGEAEKTGFVLEMDGEIHTSDGRALYIGGLLYELLEKKTELWHLDRGIFGSFRGVGSTVAQSALSEGKLQPQLELRARLTPSSGERELIIDGRIAGISGALPSASFRNATLTSGGHEDGCAREPKGSVSLRDGQGHWYDVTFDGIDESGDRTAQCDGCGPTTLDGKSLGSSCVNTKPLLALEMF